MIIQSFAFGLDILRSNIKEKIYTLQINNREILEEKIIEAITTIISKIMQQIICYILYNYVLHAMVIILNIYCKNLF